MPLQQELGLPQPFHHFEHEALLNIYYTAAVLKKRADAFFRDHNLTDVQFNVLMLLINQAGDEGLTQVDLSRMMLVNRANITGIVDRMEKAGLIARKPMPGDRRYNRVVITNNGRRIFEDTEKEYQSTVKAIMRTLGDRDQKKLVRLLEALRQGISE
ncbi:MAG: MarR family transcriptional regulator [Candidatus Hydrogenedentes bacterium]|nr:MarR family transcriptional regulator [Candidatus Hydrogenedentota bacterium]